ncbi:MAG: transcription elongation GreA/GreB family factor [Flavobacterium sp.]|jgi:transcription elongation GreA/GreB family factor
MKQEILNYYKQQLQDKEDLFRDRITALTEDSKNDSKGSAGDKHETALSMMHLEQEKINFKLKEILEQKAILEKINADKIHKVVALGSLVKVNTMTVFVSTALPKIIIEDISVFAISPQSPLGSNLMGNSIGFQFEMNGNSFTLLEVT